MTMKGASGGSGKESDGSCCVLEFRGRKAEGDDATCRYTELFTSLRRSNRSGSRAPSLHAPECRWERFKSFCLRLAAGSSSERWLAALGLLDIDTCAPCRAGGAQRSSPVANLADLPNGVFVKFAEEPCLVHNDWLLAWSAGGYTKRIERPHNAEVIVLTPKSTLATISAGYVNEIHTSENRWGDGP